MMGGVCVNTGTIPSKTLREAVLYLTGFAQRDMYGASYRVKSEITIADLLARTAHVVGREIEVIRNQLLRNHVDILGGTARFEDEHTVVVRGEARGDTSTVTAANVVIATGTRPARPSEVEFDDDHVIDSDAVLKLQRVPGSLVVVGAGVIGIEYASMFAALGTRVTVVEKRPQMLEFCDPEVVESLEVPPPRPGRHLPLRRGGGEGGDHPTGHGDQPGQRQAHRRRHGHVLGRPAGCHRRAAAGEGGAVRGQAGPDPGGRAVPHRGTAHLRGRRRDRLPGPRGDQHGPGPAGRVARVRRAGPRVAPPAADRHLHGPGDLLLRADRGRADPVRGALRGGHLPVPGAGPRGDRRGLLRDAQAAGLQPGPDAARGARVRHQRHRPGAHRAGHHGVRRDGGLPGGHGAQLPDAVRGVQGGGAGRDEQDARVGRLRQTAAEPRRGAAVSSRRRAGPATAVG